MEGLRAPAIGKAFPKAATVVSGRAAALATMAAASIGMGLGGVDYANYQPGGVQAPPSVQRAAASIKQIATMEAQAAEGLLGNVAQKAPSLARSGGAALAAAGSTLAPTVERGLGSAAAANGLGAAARALAPIAGKLGSAFSPLAAVIPDLLFPAAANRGEDEALKKQQDADRQAARKGGDRVGDKFKNGKNPRLRDPGAGTEAGVLYQVNFSLHFQGQADYQGSVILPGPIGGVNRDASPVYENTYNFTLTFGGGQRHGLIGNGDQNANATITGINRVSDGQDAPVPDLTDPSGGLTLPATNSNSPTLPTLPRSGSLPATASARPPSTGSPKPNEGVRNPDRPSQPSPGDPTVPGNANAPTPQTPLQPANPSTPSQGIQTPTPTLPGIPSAPTNGSASLQAPIFNPTFTPIPGIRSDQPFEPVQRLPEEPTEPPGCADPCIQALNEKADKAAKKADESKLVDLNIPVFTHCTGSNSNVETRTIKVPKDEAENYHLLYERIYALESLQCNPVEAIAAVPDWWQVRIEGARPQLIIHFAQRKDDGTLGYANYTLSFPHPIIDRPTFSPISSYRKGQIEGILTLNDNSKLIVNAYNNSEVERVFQEAVTFIDPKLLVGSFTKIGTRRGQAFREITVYPKYAKYFSQGLQNLKPDWVVHFPQI